MSQLGPAYDPAIDEKRLDNQRERIRTYCLAHGWVTLHQLAAALEYPEASISAQLRHLKKPQYGAYRLEKRRRLHDRGTYEYQLQYPVHGPGEPKLQLTLFATPNQMMRGH